MDFNLSPEEEAFRDEVRAFLDANLPPESERDARFLAEWSRKVRAEALGRLLLARARWAAAAAR